jgi:hypothetical protein
MHRKNSFTCQRIVTVLFRVIIGYHVLLAGSLEVDPNVEATYQSVCALIIKLHFKLYSLIIHEVTSQPNALISAT